MHVSTRGAHTLFSQGCIPNKWGISHCATRDAKTSELFREKKQTQEARGRVSQKVHRTGGRVVGQKWNKIAAAVALKTWQQQQQQQHLYGLTKKSVPLGW